MRMRWRDLLKVTLIKTAGVIHCPAQIYVIHCGVYIMAARKRVCITVDEETLRLADREARCLNISRSDFIRLAVSIEVKKADSQETGRCQRKPE